MIQHRGHLTLQDRDTFRATVAFLNKRLAEQGTIDWALRLTSGQRAERVAIEDLLKSAGAHDLREPWATAWRLIEESWSSEVSDRDDGTAIYGIQRRLRAGDRSGAVVVATVNLVAPRLKVEPIDSWRWSIEKRPRTPKTFRQILSASLTSGKLLDLNVLELSSLTDVPFLTSLATAVEATIVHGLGIAHRLGWDETRSFLGLGMINRVYYSRLGEDGEPDAYNRGIAPSVKLLHAVVARISELDSEAVQPIIQRWRLEESPVQSRLWAAMSRNKQVTSAEKVSAFLLGSDDKKFWNLHVYPEIAELRARRFGDLNQGAQSEIAVRLQKGPPRDHWPRKAIAAEVNNARIYWAVRELRRIEVAGGILPERSKSWLDSRKGPFADLDEMEIDEGFPGGVIVRSVPSSPDDRYNTLEGVERLRALETALSKGRGSWNDDPAERANDWLQQKEKSALVLSDFEAAGNGGDDFPRVWDRFGWAHSPRPSEPVPSIQRDLPLEAARVLALLNQLSDETLLSAIQGISAWLDSWKEHIVVLPLGLPVWLRIWPIAVRATNSQPEEDNVSNLSVISRDSDDPEPVDIDTLNTPAGKLVGVFLTTCPKLASNSQIFLAGSMERQMRDAVISAPDHSGLIVRHRLIEALPYFLRADRDWAQEYLLAPLLRDVGTSMSLWRAIARRTHFTDVLEIIGATMAERATDRRLGRKTRSSLAFSLVIESLHAFRERREPAVRNSRLQQMLRILDDEVRTTAANTIQRFVADLSAKPPRDQFAGTPEALFHSAAVPFLRDVWPQEHSLATPSVSGALADLPATSREAFADAVEAIARFLVPFNCWSMLDYGLYGEEDGQKKLAAINDKSKAKALLRLLDLTVGASESAVIPHDLTDALDQIYSIAPELAATPAYRRLSTTARR